MASSAPPPTASTPRCATSTRPPASSALLREPRARSPRPRERPCARSPTADAGAPASRRPSRPSPSSPSRPEKAPELANNLAIVLERPRRPQARGREGPALAGRQGLHRLRGAPPVRLRPVDGDQPLRRERLHPEGQPRPSSAASTSELARRKEQRAPASSALPRRGSARTSPASPRPTRPTPASTTAGHDAGAGAKPGAQLAPRAPKDEAEQARRRGSRPQEGARDLLSGRRPERRLPDAVAADAAPASAARRPGAERAGRSNRLRVRRSTPTTSSTTCWAHETPRRAHPCSPTPCSWAR